LINGEKIMIAKTRLGLLCAAAVFMAGAPAPASAASVADFYKNKKIRLVLSTGPGGGYATYARVLMKHMGKYIPGNPGFIKQHRQGAGGLVAANWLYNKAPKDGSVFAMIHRGAISTLPIYGAKNILYKPTKFAWIGSMNASTSTCVSWKGQKVTTFAQALKEPLIVGGIAVGSDTDIFPRVFNNIFGTKFQLITGYSSGSSLNLAMERGEIQGRCGWSWSSIKATAGQWLKDGKLNILAQVSLAKHPELGDAPLVTSFAKTKEQRAVMELVLSPQAMGRPFLAPPGVPADRLAALQSAFDAAIKDKALLADAKKRKLEINPMSGKEVTALVKKIYAIPKDVVAMAKEAIKRTDKIKTKVIKIPVATVKTTLTKIKRGGRRLSFKVKGKTEKVKVSGRRTKVFVGGKKAKRKNLKVGMKCAIAYQGTGSTAKSIKCN
jgi:tripartite-type tricarboxylate transporter receptor subunit TctC